MDKRASVKPSQLTHKEGKKQVTPYFIFNQVTNNFVVKVLDGSPLDALLDVLFLLRKVKRENKSYGTTYS